ncbi:MAG: NAD-dependent epimerase/dehydratase family protein [Candidatus Omnitrophica bacterium]|nr:NAD-dependent epimerase/dehydratase family protein [Candidatus Omnitrophota bacterium]
MKILITGGAGLVGSHCAEYFSRRADRVVVLDNLSRSSMFSSRRKSVEYNWEYLKSLRGVGLVKADIRDGEKLRELFRRQRPDAVIHTASQPGVRASVEDPRMDFSVNALGTFNALEALRLANPRGVFIYCSTNKVYGDNVNRLPLGKKAGRYVFADGGGVDESSSVDQTGHTPYGVSKLAGDLYVQDYAHTYGLKTGVFRMSCIYGTRQFAFEDHGWIAWFALRVLQGEPITICGDGRQVRDVLWVDDLVQAFAKFIQKPVRHGVFNIGGGPKNTLSLRELLGMLEDATGRKAQVKFRPWRPFDQKVYISDITKVSKALRWNPEVPPLEGVGRLVRWIGYNRGLFSS